MRCRRDAHSAARERLTDLLAIWPETPSLMSISHFHPYLQTVGDTLHILDGGTTERILLYIGNWLFDSGDAHLNINGRPWYDAEHAHVALR